MTLEAGLVFAILGGAIILFVGGWVRSDIVALLVLATLVITGLLPAEEALSGFASDAVIATAGLLVLSAGLVRSGVMRWIAKQLNTIAGGGPIGLVALSTVFPGVLSGLVSDIGTVSLFVPVMLRLARKNDVSRKRLLLPLAMAVLAGGNLTLIGSSHNLVVNSLMRDAGLPELGFFEIAPVGAALVIAFALYTFFLSRHLLPDGEVNTDRASGPFSEALIETYDLQDRLWEVWVGEDSSLGGQAVHELELGEDYGLNLLTVVRDEKNQLVTGGDMRVAADDILLIEGRRERLESFTEVHPRLKLMGHPRQQELFPASNAELIEVVVPPRSQAVGKTLVDLDLRAESGLSGLAIWRERRPYRTDVGEMTLRPGDALLLYGSREKTRSFDPGIKFLWLHPPFEEEAPQELRHLGPLAFIIMALVVITAGLDLLPISVASLAGGVAMVLLGILTAKRLYENVEWHTVVLIGAMYPLGLAMEATGASRIIASFLIEVFGAFGPLVALLGILGVAILLTQFLHGAAVAIIMAPIALATAASLEVEPRAFLIAVIVGAASTYLLPVGHPAPLLVRSPGKYESVDYVKFGFGLVIITLLLAAILLPWLWPF
jgi:di/tricarboxylate transporter